jgi:hypothetical protein
MLAVSAWGQAGMKVYQRVPLSAAADGFDGHLELLEDSRLTAARRKALWRAGAMAMEDDTPLWADFQRTPPRNGALRLVDAVGRAVETLPLERPLATIKPGRLYGNVRVTYLVTVDYGIGAGSYNGPITFLLEVVNGRLHWLEATPVGSSKPGKISLMRSLKTAWQMIDAPGGTKQFLEAACRPDSIAAPDASDIDFFVTYSRYYFDGERWRVAQRRQKGLDEFEDGFPARSLFP